MDRTPGKDQPMCDKRASGGADFSRAVPEYFSQLVRNLFISVMSCPGGGSLILKGQGNVRCTFQVLNKCF